MPVALRDAVWDLRLTSFEWHSRYGHFLDLTHQLLGCTPTFSQFAHHSPLTIDFYMGAINDCFQIPKCDLGFSVLTAAQRRWACMTSSLTHKCAYCVGHICIMGDIVTGSQFKKVERVGGWGTYSQGLVEGENDQVLKQLVREVCGFPAIIKRETRQRFVEVFGERGYDEVTSIVAFMGWLNYAMDSFGMHLESEAAPFAELILRSVTSDFTLSGSVAKDGNEVKGRDTLDWLTSPKVAPTWRRLVAYVKLVWNFVSIVPSIVRATLWQKGMFGGIPKTGEGVEAFMLKSFGCVPSYVGMVEDVVLKRVLAYGSREAFMKDEQTNWTREERVGLFYVFAKEMGNADMVEDAVLMTSELKAHTGKSGIGKKGEHIGSLLATERRAQLDGLYDIAVSGNDAVDRFEVGLKFVRGCAGPAGTVSDEVKTQVIDLVKDPRSIVDLPGLVAFFAFIHRVTVFRRAIVA